jgi:predicted GTPase
MFEDPPDDVGVTDQRDDVHRRAALETLQRIDLVDLVVVPTPIGRALL